MMQLRSPHCSDATGWYRVLVLEGMPGAGKTTAATALAAENRTVVGEYTSPTGAIIPIEAHPALDDDTAHQHNWLCKHHQVQAARRDSPVFCDRDWLSALAYAYSVMDDGELLSKRARWVSDHLDRGNLALASSYVLFQLDPRVSLRRRADRLTPGHPWSSLPGLVRLAAYYRDPAEALVPVQPDLAARLRTTTWHSLRDCTVDRTVRFLRDLADLP